jgi:hypothetical protein
VVIVGAERVPDSPYYAETASRPTPIG